MMIKLRVALVNLILLLPNASWAYREALHEKLSTTAFEKLDITQQSVIETGLGISLSDDYLDWDGKPEHPKELIGSGAVQEDKGKRSLAHFFNPQWAAGRQGAVYGVMPSSKEWVVDGANRSVLGTPQEYSYAHARDYHLYSLTSPDPVVRANYTGKLFQSLGHIVHHIQDMAQPQHVRDDIHCHMGEPLVSGLGSSEGCKQIEQAVITAAAAAGWTLSGGNPVGGLIGAFVGSQIEVHEPSAYEEFSFKRLASNNNSKLNELLASPYANQLFASNRVFSLPGDYWENTQGSGMAEFTSRNFVSIETDFEVSESAGNINVGPFNGGFFFAIPKPDPAELGAYVVAERIENVIAEDPTLKPELPDTSLTGDIYFVRASVFDSLTDTLETVNRMTAFSVFNEALTAAGKKKVVTQNQFTYDSRMKVLIPRAVALSSGFMEYFFRGRLDVVEAGTRRSDGNWYWDVQLRNMSNEAMAGPVTFYYDNAGVRTAFYTIGALSLSPGQTSTTYAIQMPAAITDPVAVAVVFHGQLGAEAKNVTSAFSSVTPPDVPAIPCGQAKSAAGGDEGYSRTTHSLGNVPGRVQVEFEAYSIPDQIIVRRPDNNVVLAWTSQKVSGLHSLNFDHNPSEYGNDVSVEVIANADPGTQWTFTMGCPGETIDDGDRAIDQKTVTFSYGCNAVGCVYCSGLFYIDGFQKFAFGGTGSASLKLIPGPHSYEFRNVQCNTTSQSSSYPFSYTDSTGSHSLSNPIPGGGGPMPIQ